MELRVIDEGRKKVISKFFLRSCFDSISLRPSQFGYAITETHHDSLSVPAFLIKNHGMKRQLD
jgi:hypothetical protein